MFAGSAASPGTLIAGPAVAEPCPVAAFAVAASSRLEVCITSAVREPSRNTLTTIQILTRFWPSVRRLDTDVHRQEQHDASEQIGDRDQRVARPFAGEAVRAGAPARVVRAAEEADQPDRQQDQGIDDHEERQEQDVAGPVGEVAAEPG